MSLPEEGMTKRVLLVVSAEKAKEINKQFDGLHFRNFPGIRKMPYTVFSDPEKIGYVNGYNDCYLRFTNWFKTEDADAQDFPTDFPEGICAQDD